MLLPQVAFPDSAGSSGGPLHVHLALYTSSLKALTSF